MAYLRNQAFYFDFVRFSMDNASTEEAKDYGVVKKVMLEKFSSRKSQSEIIREGLMLQYGRGDILSFL